MKIRGRAGRPASVRSRASSRTYDPAFTKDNHDSVAVPPDYIMTVWNDGKLVPYKGKHDWGKKH